MEHAKQANGSEHELPIGRSPSPGQHDQKDAARSPGKKAVRKKAAPRKAKPARPLRKEMCVWRIADSGEISNSPHTGSSIAIAPFV